MQFALKPIQECLINPYIRTLLPAFKLNQIDKYKFKEHRDMHLKAWSLLLEFLEINNYPIDNIKKMHCNQYGKPYIDGIYFSISYSKPYILVAISKEEIGADIEVVNELYLTDIKPFLHPDELEIVDKSTTTEKLYNIWVKKEAVLKLLGTGFQRIPSEINVLQKNIAIDKEVIVLQSISSDSNLIAYIARYTY